MSKTKKSKLLASMLCATVMAGLYAGPVMAGNQMDTKVDAGNSLTIVVRPGGGGIDGDTYEEGKDGMFNAGGVFAQVAGQLTIKSSDLVTALRGSNMALGAVTANSLTIGEVTLNTENITKWNEHMNASEDHFEEIDKHEEELEQRMQAEEQALEKVEDKTANITGVVTDGGKESTTFKGKVIADKFGNSNDTFWVDTKGQLSAANMKFYVGSSGEFKAANGNFEVKNNGDVTTVGNVTAEDVVANGTSLVNVGVAVTGLTDRVVNVEDKTQNIRRIGNATIFSERVGINDRGLSIAANNGDTAIDITKEGNITAVGEIKGDNVYSANYDLETVGYNTQAISYENGVTTVSGVDFANGVITADKLTLSGLNQDVATEINDLKDSFGNVDTDLGALTDRVANVEDKTQNIRRIGNATIFSERVGINDRGLSIAADNGDTAIDITKEGNITAVGDIKGDNVYSSNYDLETVGYNTQAISYENGVTTVSGVDFANGAITAETLNGANIDELIASVGTIGETNKNVAGIQRDGETTTIEETLSVSKDGISANVGSSQLIVTDEVAGMTSGNASLALTNNEASLSAAGNSVVVNHDGVTFNTTNNGTTVINGGAITAETLNGADIDELIASVGTIGETNKNTAGIERKEVQTIDGTGYATVIEDGTVIGSDGSFSTAFGKLTVEKDGRFSLSSDAWFGGDVNYKYVNKDGSISYGSLQDLTDRVSDLEDKTQNIDSGSTHGPSKPSEGEGPVDNGAHTGINGDVTVGGDANVKGDVNVDGNVNVGDKAQIGNGNISVGEDGNKTTIDNGNITVDNGESGKVEIGNGDVTVTGEDGKEHSIQGNAEDIANIREDMGEMSNRISKVEDRIDKVGAMSAAIANLRTMGYDPTAPTEIAVGIGQYRSETGAALGLFHYPNKDFMLSLSVSTSGDEVMGGIGATWKFGRKSPEQMLAAEKEKAAKAKHAKMAAEKAAK